MQEQLRRCSDISGCSPCAEASDLRNIQGCVRRTCTHTCTPPLLQVFGRLNKTIEGVPVEEGASFVNKYFLLTTNLKPTDTLTLSLDDGELEEGYYHLSAKVGGTQARGCFCMLAPAGLQFPGSAQRTPPALVRPCLCLLLPLPLQVAVITKFPFLVDLQGPARINQTDIDSIMGFTGEPLEGQLQGALLQKPLELLSCAPAFPTPCAFTCTHMQTAAATTAKTPTQSTWASWCATAPTMRCRCWACRPAPACPRYQTSMWTRREWPSRCEAFVVVVLLVAVGQRRVGGLMLPTTGLFSVLTHVLVLHACHNDVTRRAVTR